MGLFAFFYGTLHFLTWAIADRFAGLDFPDGIVFDGLHRAATFAASVVVPTLLQKAVHHDRLYRADAWPCGRLALTSTAGDDPPARQEIGRRCTALIYVSAALGVDPLLRGCQGRRHAPGDLRGDRGAARLPFLVGASARAVAGAGADGGRAAGLTVEPAARADFPDNPGMKRRDFIVSSALGSVGAGISQPLTAYGQQPLQFRQQTASQTPPTRKILIAGGGFGEGFVRHMAQLTGKPKLRLCFLPTASADSAAATIVSWFRSCANLECTPCAQQSFIASATARRSELGRGAASSMDGIVCSGETLLISRPIWKAQGIDVVLRKAWDQGIVLGGASAGSLCWFEEGTTDSRPKELSTVWCLGFHQGQPLAALRQRGRPPAALQEAHRIGSDEAWLRLRQRRRHFFRGQRREAGGRDAARRQGTT